MIFKIFRNHITLKYMKIKQKIMIQAVLIPIFSVLILTLFATYKTSKTATSVAKTMANVTAKNTIDKIERNFYERFGDVRAFAADLTAKTALTEGNTSPVTNFMNKMMNYYVIYEIMLLADAQGKIVAINTKDRYANEVSNSKYIGINVSNQAWFINAIKASMDEAYYSDVVDKFMIDHDESDQKKGMIFSAPVYGDSGNVLGVWYNFASWIETGGKIIQEAELDLSTDYPNSEIVLFDRYGKVIESRILNPNVRYEIDFEKNRISIDSKEKNLEEKDLKNAVVQVAKSRGAYTYSGRQWVIASIIRSNMNFLQLLFKEQIVLLILGFLTVAVNIATSTSLSKYLIKSFTDFRNLASNLAKGKINIVNITRTDEIGEVYAEINRLSKSLEQKTSFAKAVGDNNFNTKLELSSNEDTLGLALIDMQKKLLQASEEEKIRKWIVEGIAEFSEITRINTNLNELCDKVLKKLVHYTNSIQGGIFIVDDSDTNHIVLTLISAYAYERKKYITKTIEPGEGLLGQCYKEKEFIYMTDIPSDYMKITSGLGGSSPKALLIMPIKTNDAIVGVVEIASFSSYSPHVIEFVEKVTQNLASVISTTKINDMTKRLLTQTQQQAEQLRTQEKEMRQKLEELIATQDEMKRKSLANESHLST